MSRRRQKYRLAQVKRIAEWHDSLKKLDERRKINLEIMEEFFRKYPLYDTTNIKDLSIDEQELYDKRFKEHFDSYKEKYDLITHINCMNPYYKMIKS